MRLEQDRAEVLLIAGPMGSGKSTVAEHLARRLGWEWLSEDRWWVPHGWSGWRSPEQEAVVQRQVIEHLLATCRSGRGAVLEFILYAEPPNPLTAYEHALAQSSLAYRTILLRASVSEILRRLADRGRPRDLEQPADRRREVEHQLRVLDSDAMRSYPVLDTTEVSVEGVQRACLDLLGQPVSPAGEPERR